MNIVFGFFFLVLGIAFAGFLGWIAVQSGLKTFSVTENVQGAEKHWTRFAGVVTGIAFMSSAIAVLLSALAPVTRALIK